MTLEEAIHYAKSCQTPFDIPAEVAEEITETLLPETIMKLAAYYITHDSQAFYLIGEYLHGRDNRGS